MRAILTYHSIDPSGSPISVHPDDFAEQVAWLRSGQVKVVTIDELVRLPDDEHAVAITFDDGFANFATAAPVLLDAALPVTLFVVSDHVGQTNAWGGRTHDGIPCLPLLGWDALGKLAEQGVRLGAHTRTHPVLTTLSPDAIDHEMAGSAEAIERHTGCRPTAFAYPYGLLNPSVARAAAARFTVACTTEFRTLSSPVAPVELPRLDMFYFRRTSQLSTWGSARLAASIRVRHAARRLRRRLTTHPGQATT